MDEYSYKKIDAFTSEKSLGNPAACICLESGQTLAEDKMQVLFGGCATDRIIGKYIL
jgi:predicted PhzF superfamily epimerase YddE/YHI9